VKQSFQDIEEIDRLLPNMETKGKRIKNEIEKYPDLPFDSESIIYKAPKQSYVFTPETKDPSPAPDADFLGLDDSGGSIPPDVNGAPGPNHLMVTLNTGYRIMERDGTPISTFNTGAFWHATPGASGVFDPKISYDPIENRWILVEPSSSDPSLSKILVAVSETDDPTGNWFMYSFDGDPDNTHWFDYPNYGFSKDKIVVTGNLFGSGGVYVAVYVFDKADLYNFAPVIEYTRIKTYDGFTIVPAKTYDPDVEDIYMVHNAGGDISGYGYVNLWKVTGPANDPELSNIGFSGVPEPWANGSYFTGGNFAPQLDSDELINTVDARMENMVYRNGKLWTTHHVYLPANDPQRCAVQWWNLALDGEILQWGRVDDPTGLMYFAFASIAVNAKEDVMIGFGSFSEEQYASASYAFRYAEDPVNTMRDYYQYKDGLAPYYKTFGGARNRWGDYTSTFVDPVDDLDFWTLQEYAELPEGSQDEWGTWWAYVNLDDVPEASFTSNITEVPVASGVNFTDVSKFTPTQWEWIFEGGTPSSSTDQNPQNIVYNTAGIFDVTLIASNVMGSDTLILEDYIDANTTILPEVLFVVDDSIPCVGQAVAFEDQTIYNPIEWLWEFSPNLVTFVNGTNQQSQHPEVTFDYPLVYEVTLTTTNNNGTSFLTKTAYVNSGGMVLPFTEDFESLSFDTRSWTVQNPDDEKTWDFEPVEGNGDAGHAAYVNFKNYAGYQERDRLISPELNFYGHKEITMEFQYAYGQRFNGVTDSLIIYISEDCGTTWSRVAEFAEDPEEGRNFATIEPTSFPFVPANPEEWCGSDNNPECVVIDLSDWTGKSNIHLMFETYNGYGNNIFIDNVVIDGTIIDIETNPIVEPVVGIFPNPSQGIVHIDLENFSGNSTLNVYNINGAKIISMENVMPGQEQIDLTDFPKGVYLLEVTNGDFQQMKKVILQ